MNPRIKSLIELQEIDSTIIFLKQGIKNLESRIEDAKKPFDELLSQINREKNHYDELCKKRREKELDLDSREDRINKMKARTSEIKTNKEYLAHLKEIEAAEEEKAQNEEVIISLMDSIERLADQIRSEESKVTQLEKDFKKEEKQINHEQHAFVEKIDTYKQKRDNLVKSVSKGDYQTYMTLYNNRGGKAVVETKSEICLGCNMNIPPQLFNDIKSNEEILTCSYCSRILYYKDGNEHSDDD